MVGAGIPAHRLAATHALLVGPGNEEAGERTITSAIPDGSTLLGLTIKNGVATADLATEFDSGGDAASQRYRLAQVVYTPTQFATVRSVVFQIDGQTVSVFGSEGIVLAGPVVRADSRTPIGTRGRAWSRLPSDASTVPARS